MGRRPLDSATIAAILRGTEELDHFPLRRRRRRFGMIPAVGAGVACFLIGSTGLAAADALPSSAQSVAHGVLGSVRVDVPDGKSTKRGPCVAEAAKIEDEAAKQAAKDACPKGGGFGDDQPGNGDRGKADVAPGQTRHEGDPCHGRPAWAGRMTKQEREAAKVAASRASCPDEDDASESAAETGE